MTVAYCDTSHFTEGHILSEDLASHLVPLYTYSGLHCHFDTSDVDPHMCAMYSSPSPYIDLIYLAGQAILILK